MESEDGTEGGKVKMMTTLIRREFGMMDITRRVIKPYFLFSIGALGLAWILGPRVIGVVGVEQSSLLLTLISFSIAYVGVTVNLERDTANRQQTFLQTLPVEKSRIVNAKFLSIFLISILVFIWSFVLVIINIFVNNGEWMYLAIACIMGSVFLFVAGTPLVSYFIWGQQRTTMAFLLALAVYTFIFIIVIAVYFAASVSSFYQFTGLTLLFVSIFIYLICWRAVVWKVKKSGIPRGKA